MKLTEIFKPGGKGVLPWDEMHGSNDAAVYGFVLNGDIHYEVHFEKVTQKGLWEFSFTKKSAETGDATAEIAPTGGKAVSVFATIIDILRHFSERHHPRFLTFTAKELSRRKLYRRFASKLDSNFKEEDARNPEGNFIKKYTVRAYT